MTTCIASARRPAKLRPRQTEFWKPLADYSGEFDPAHPREPEQQRPLFRIFPMRLNLQISSPSVPALLFIILLTSVGSARAEHWPGWRGPRGDGTSKETGLPLTWSPTQNIIWKTPLGNYSMSSPIVWRDRVFVTGQTGRGPSMPDRLPAGNSAAGVVARSPKHSIAFYVSAFSAADGSTLWTQGVDPGKKLIPVADRHNLAMPTPVTDGSRIYTLFGTGVVTCFTTKGEGLWQRRLEEDYAPFDIIWGHGSSPILNGNLLYIVADHGIGSYVIALDKRNGRTVWKHDRDGIGPSYSTPILANFGSGKELIVTMSYHVRSLDPKSGALNWQSPGLLRVPIPSPIRSGQLLIASGGVRNGPVLALKPPSFSAGSANPRAQPKVIWSKKNTSPYVSSSLSHEGLLYYFDDDGIAECAEADTGTLLWKARLGGTFTGSPVLAEGNIYAINEDGDTFVIETGREFKLISQNELGQRTLASPAISGGRIFIRTDNFLYCIGSPVEPDND